jgi:hypothetical protein
MVSHSNNSQISRQGKIMENYLISRPPRSVSLNLKIKMLFGGSINFLAWGIISFGLIFCLAFDIAETVRELKIFSGEIITVEGISTGYSGTNITVNDETVIELRFSFKGIDNKEYHGRSFATGAYIDEGTAVPVEFSPHNPKYSRIEGTRYSVMGAWGLLIMLLPTAGIIILIFTLKSGISKIKILKNGIPSKGTLKKSYPTGTEINEEEVYKMIFEYRDENGQIHETSIKTTNPDVLEDDDSEKLIYNPLNPSKAVFIDTLPFKTKLDHNGNFICESGILSSFIYFILPAASIVLFLFIIDVL